MEKKITSGSPKPEANQNQDEEPIKENPPEEHPEDLSFCPECGHKTTTDAFTATGSPEDITERAICPNCFWTESFLPIPTELYNSLYFLTHMEEILEEVEF